MGRVMIEEEKETRSRASNDQGMHPRLPERNAQRNRQRDPPKRHRTGWWNKECAEALARRKLLAQMWRKGIDFGTNFLAWMEADKEFKEIVKKRKDGMSLFNGQQPFYNMKFSNSRR